MYPLLLVTTCNFSFIEWTSFSVSDGTIFAHVSFNVHIKSFSFILYLVLRIFFQVFHTSLKLINFFVFLLFFSPEKNLKFLLEKILKVVRDQGSFQRLDGCLINYTWKLYPPFRRINPDENNFQLQLWHLIFKKIFLHFFGLWRAAISCWGDLCERLKCSIISYI